MQRIEGIIFRRTIRASYCSLDLILIDKDNDGKEKHTVALIQFHLLHLNPTPFRSYLRRECKLGSEVSLTGVWNGDKTKFDVTLTAINETDPVAIHFGNINGVSLLSSQKLDMIGCQRFREKYYPTFEKVVKTKTKKDMHCDGNMNVMSLNKRKKTNAKGKTGHGGGVGKRIQGELVSEFFMQLISETLEGKFMQDMNDSTIEVPSHVPQSVRSRYISFQPFDLSSEQRCSVIEYLNQGSGVIDAAGGSGHVSMGLSLNGVKSTVIDPRETVGKLPGKDKKYLRKMLKLHSDNNGSSLSGEAHSQPRPIQFDSFRAWFGKQPIGVDIEFRERSSLLSKKEQDEIPICTMCSSDGLLSQCRAIIALHPDEATDDICDFAVANKIPFLIVPCCVFSRLFPYRRKKYNDEPVATYEDLIEFLVEKHPSIRISKLDFDGSNLALWSTFNMSDSM